MGATLLPLNGPFAAEPYVDWNYVATLYEDGNLADLTDFTGFEMKVRAHRRDGDLLAVATCAIVPFSAPDTYDNQVSIHIADVDITNEWPRRCHYDLVGTKTDGTRVRFVYGPFERGPLTCTYD